ncbi:MAG TPA: glycoside hydrolase family 28 protein [Candidatus Aquilonibacter sp.]|nr:glycoside hydrolase family 28 protein [Candidatus Aquilonibacter sp.]
MSERSERRDFLWAASSVLAGSSVGALGVGARTTYASPKAAVGAGQSAFDVRNYGAKGDGTSVDTDAINKAIDAAAAAGGGMVLLPAGNYLCYSIHLKSNIGLYLDHGATIIAAETPANGVGGYDAAEPNQWDQYQDYGHSHFHNSLIWGENIENISISGPGRIWGKGLTRGQGESNPGVGDKCIALKNSHNILLRDFQIFHGGHFGVLATAADNMTIDNLMIDTNRDGIDIDCCHNVRVTNCSINSPWDDALVPKSSYALGYARSTAQLTISNCFVSGSYQEGTLLDGTMKLYDQTARVPRTGRIKFGTESNGGFNNITITNCVFDGCQGFALETVDGALLEDFTVSNLTMRNITSAPIFMRLGSRMRGPSDLQIGALRRVIVSNVVCSNSVSRLGSIISGIPNHPIENVVLNDIHVRHQGGGTKEQAAIVVPEDETKYPEPGMFGPMPSQGFFIRHAKNIELRNIEIRAMEADERSAFVLDDVQGADFFNVRADLASGVPAFVLKDVEDFNVHLSRPTPDTHIDKTAQQSV